MSIKALQQKVKALARKVPIPSLEMMSEEWANIQRVLYTTEMCETCRARVDQALAELAQLQPVRGGYTQQQAQAIYRALSLQVFDTCLYRPDWNHTCNIRIASAFMEEAKALRG